MLDPFDSEFLSQELRETWKKVEELEKENKELREEKIKLKEHIKTLTKQVWEDDYRRDRF